MAETTPKPIKDVAHPDETVPDASARPIIVTNRPIMKDTMVNEAPADPDEEKVPVKLTPKPKLKLTPLEAKPVADQDQPKEPAPADTERPVEQPPSEPKEPAPTEAEQPAEGSEGPGSTMNAGNVAAAEEAEAAKQAEHEAAIEKLVDSKQYFLPINAIEKRKSKRFVAAGVVLSVVLVLAWLDIALDAGLIRLGGLHSVTHFFSN